MDSAAVIFDVDGVLVDSYDAHFRSWRDLGRRTGVAITLRQFADTFGMTSRDIIRRFWSDRIADEDVAELDRQKEARFREIVAADFPIMDGATELLLQLRDAGFDLAVGSSGPPENVELAVSRLGPPGLFSAIVTGSDVTRGKPDPQVFQIAAKRLGRKPTACAVIEDAPAGIEAAKAAGMTGVVLLSTGRKRKDFDGVYPDLIVSALRELSPEVICRLLE